MNSLHFLLTAINLPVQKTFHTKQNHKRKVVHSNRPMDIV